jgi:hypothetical protein
MLYRRQVRLDGPGRRDYVLVLRWLAVACCVCVWVYVFVAAQGRSIAAGE